MHHGILIIGSGMAGVTLAREVRKLDARADVAIVTESSGDYYAKPALSNALAAAKTAEQLRLFAAAKLESDIGIRIHAGVRVDAIDPAAHLVATSAGTIGYDKLILAVGARQRVLAPPGGAAGEVISVNDLEDYAALRQRLCAGARVAIVGAGLIGCEFANDLRLGGYAVDLYDVSAALMPRLLPPPAADRMRSSLEAVGVRFHLECAIAGIERTGTRLTVTDSRGDADTYDVVMSAIGLQPELALARAAGLDTGIGVRTDAFLATSQEDIFALGDCAEVCGMLLPYIPPIMQGARALARTLVVERTPVRYPAMPIVVKTPACPTVACPPTAGDGAWSIDDDERSLRALHHDASTGALSGFVLQGEAIKDRMRLAAGLPDVLPAAKC